MSEDVQINVADLMTGFATEIGAYAKRAVIAETKVAAMDRTIAALRAEITRLRTEPQPGTEIVPDPEAYRNGLADGWNGRDQGVPYEEVVGDVIRTAGEPPTPA